MKKLTTSEVANQLGIGKSTVTLYCRQGRFPNAESIDTPRGAIWYIPEGDVKAFTPPTNGRPPKVTPVASKRVTGQIRATNAASIGRSGTKKGGKK
jgi:transcriptional regulator with XRE-family HTH domain